MTSPVQCPMKTFLSSPDQENELQASQVLYTRDNFIQDPDTGVFSGSSLHDLMVFLSRGLIWSVIVALAHRCCLHEDFLNLCALLNEFFCKILNSKHC